MSEHAPATIYEARWKRGARLLAAGVLAAVAILAASHAGSGSDRSQPAPTTLQLTVAPAGPSQAYTVTSTTSNGTRTVVLHRRGRAVRTTSTGRVVRVRATTKR
jgi:hypothetical protein